MFKLTLFIHAFLRLFLSRVCFFVHLSPTERLEPLDAGRRSDGCRDGRRPLPQPLQEQLHLGHKTQANTHTERREESVTALLV